MAAGARTWRGEYRCDPALASGKAQTAREVACESRHEPRKDANMDDRIEDAGNGVLFRNEKR
jgi:hypothetical protein